MPIKPIAYSPLDFQLEFHKSIKPKVYLSAGLGSGKTHSLVMKLFQLMTINYGCAGGILAPTLKMFKRDVLPTIKEIAQENNIEFEFNKSDSIFHFPDTKSTIYVFHAEDEGHSIRGPNLGFGVINEITLIDRASYDAFVGRIRLKAADLRQVAMSGSPESFSWHYEYFVENPRSDTDLIFGDTRKNIHISSDYVEMLRDSYDPLMFEQFVEGKFVNTTGNRACYGFNRQKHVRKDIGKRPMFTTWVSMDFNVNPMTATLYNRMGASHAHSLEAFDEVVINSSNTYEMVDVLKKKLSPHDDVVIYPDPAGNARSTKSVKTDIQILKEGGFSNIKFKSRIPSVRDCLNATNNLLSKDKILISANCKNLIADLEQCQLKQGTGELDKSDPKRTHSLDGLKNMIDYEFPIVKGYTTLRQPKVR